LENAAETLKTRRRREFVAQRRKVAKGKSKINFSLRLGVLFVAFFVFSSASSATPWCNSVSPRRIPISPRRDSARIEKSTSFGRKTAKSPLWEGPICAAAASR
jgi:hypothetical protein